MRRLPVSAAALATAGSTTGFFSAGAWLVLAASVLMDLTGFFGALEDLVAVLSAAAVGFFSTGFSGLVEASVLLALAAEGFFFAVCAFSAVAAFFGERVVEGMEIIGCAERGILGRNPPILGALREIHGRAE